jgi:hypothetical protein
MCSGTIATIRDTEWKIEKGGGGRETGSGWPLLGSQICRLSDYVPFSRLAFPSIESARLSVRLPIFVRKVANESIPRRGMWEDS